VLSLPPAVGRADPDRRTPACRPSSRTSTTRSRRTCASSRRPLTSLSDLTRLEVKLREDLVGARSEQFILLYNNIVGKSRSDSPGWEAMDAYFGQTAVRRDLLFNFFVDTIQPMVKKVDITKPEEADEILK
jgi:hypothetical protein